MAGEFFDELVGKLESNPNAAGKDGSFFDQLAGTNTSKGKPRKTGLMEAATQGLKQGATGYSTTPDWNYAPETTGEKLVYGASQIVSDLPAMAVGGIVGSPLTPLGSAAMAFATPSMIRESRKLSDTGKGGTLEAGVDILKEGGKSAAIGAATSLTGMIGGLLLKGSAPTLGKVASAYTKAPPVMSIGGKFAGEYLGLTTSSAGVEGKLPTAEDFAMNLMLLAGLKVAQVPGDLVRKITERNRSKLIAEQRAATDPRVQTPITPEQAQAAMEGAAIATKNAVAAEFNKVFKMNETEKADYLAQSESKLLSDAIHNEAFAEYYSNYPPGTNPKKVLEDFAAGKPAPKRDVPTQTQQVLDVSNYSTGTLKRLANDPKTNQEHMPQIQKELQKRSEELAKQEAIIRQKALEAEKSAARNILPATEEAKLKSEGGGTDGLQKEGKEKTQVTSTEGGGKNTEPIPTQGAAKIIPAQQQPQAATGKKGISVDAFKVLDELQNKEGKTITLAAKFKDLTYEEQKIYHKYVDEGLKEKKFSSTKGAQKAALQYVNDRRAGIERTAEVPQEEIPAGVRSAPFYEPKKAVVAATSPIKISKRKELSKMSKEEIQTESDLLESELLRRAKAKEPLVNILPRFKLLQEKLTELNLRAQGGERQTQDIGNIKLPDKMKVQKEAGQYSIIKNDKIISPFFMKLEDAVNWAKENSKEKTPKAVTPEEKVNEDLSNTKENPKQSIPIELSGHALGQGELSREQKVKPSIPIDESKVTVVPEGTSNAIKKQAAGDAFSILDGIDKPVRETPPTLKNLRKAAPTVPATPLNMKVGFKYYGTDVTAKVTHETAGKVTLEYFFKGDKDKKKVFLTKQEASEYINKLKEYDRTKNRDFIKDLIENRRFEVPDQDTTLHANPLAPTAKWLKSKIVDRILNMTTKDNEIMQNLLIRKLQDKYITLKNVEEYVAGVKGQKELGHDISAYKAEELMSGKTYVKLELFEKNLVDPLNKSIESAVKDGVSLKDIDDYLFAKHQAGRTAHIMGRTSNLPPNAWAEGYGARGWTPQRATDTIQRLSSEGKLAHVEIVTNHVYRINQLGLKLMKDYGMISEKQYQYKKNDPNFAFYVPMKGKEGVESRPTTGKGLSTTKGWKPALGGKSEATDSPLLRSIADLEATIIRGEKNLVGNKFLDIVQEGLKDGTFTPEDFRIDSVAPKATLDKNGRIVFRDVQERITEKDNTFATMKDGETYYITMDDSHKILAQTMNNVGSTTAEFGGKVLRTLSAGMRYLAAIKTSFNPEFAITNPIRDMFTATLNMGVEKSAKLSAKILRDTINFQAIRGMYKGSKWDNSTEWSRAAIELREQGGTMGFFSMQDLEMRGKALEHKIKAATGDKAAQIMDAFNGGMEVMSDYVAAGENGVRLATYKNLRDLGYTKEQAASAAKNVTVNFNRSGEMGRYINAGYLFFNANLQGTARLLTAMSKNPERFAKAAMGVAGLGLIIGMINRWVMGNDKDGVNFYDKITPDIKGRNLIIPTPMANEKEKLENRYFKIPMPYGYNALYVIGQTIESLINDPLKKKGSAVLDITSAVFDAFNPLGSSKNPFSMLMPTMVKPFSEMITNENWAGSPIKPEQVKFRWQKPESENYYPNVSEQSKYLSKQLNALTGGNDKVKGNLDISPEWIDHMATFLMGGAFDFPRRVADMARKQFYTKEQIEIKDVPVLRRFIGEKSPFINADLFTKNINEARETFENAKAHGVKTVREPFLINLAKRGEDALGRIARLNKKLNQIRQLDTLPKEKLRAEEKNIKDQINEIRLRYNKAFFDYKRKFADTPVQPQPRFD